MLLQQVHVPIILIVLMSHSQPVTQVSTKQMDLQVITPRDPRLMDDTAPAALAAAQMHDAQIGSAPAAQTRPGGAASIRTEQTTPVPQHTTAALHLGGQPGDAPVSSPLRPSDMQPESDADSGDPANPASTGGPGTS